MIKKMKDIAPPKQMKNSCELSVGRGGKAWKINVKL